MRLIDADELAGIVYRKRLDDGELITNMIAAAPTIDAVPVKALAKFLAFRLSPPYVPGACFTDDLSLETEAAKWMVYLRAEDWSKYDD